MKKLICIVFLCYTSSSIGQNVLEKLSVDLIMRDPKWIGTSPSAPYWSRDGKTLFFNWNPDDSPTDSVYYISTDNKEPRKSTFDIRKLALPAGDYIYNKTRTAFTFSRNGDIYFAETKNNIERRITQTAEAETSPSFIKNDSQIIFTREQNIFSWEIKTGLLSQITDFKKGVAPPKEPKKDSLNQHEKWLKEDQLENFEVLKSRKSKKDSAEAAKKAFPKEKELKQIYYGDKSLAGVVVSPDGRFISYRLTKRAVAAKNTVIPNYVTESGFTEDINGRTKVGTSQSSSDFFMFDALLDTVFQIKPDSIPGIKDLPDYVKDYATLDSLRKKPPVRKVNFAGPYWNESGSYAVVEIYAEDNKDRWIMLLDAVSGKLSLLDRQRDEAWIGGPGIGGYSRNDHRWVDAETYWYQSETTGYSHLYIVNVRTGSKKQLTSGNYEVQSVALSMDKKFFYLTTNQVHPGEKHFYRLPAEGGKMEKLTSLNGGNVVTLSPDEKYLAILYSYTNKPWELYLQPNKPGANAQQITSKAQSDEFKSYKWREPEVITFTARDGAQVHARLYRSALSTSQRPAVIFVHGAGYLQNAHKWWSTYFREYMFNNFLADNGYTVLDIDYRGSAGYGRDWRTGIYRFMGGKDLTDHVDGAKYLVDNLGVDAKNVGMYGGSYGGFITLMGMFTTPGVFAAGAALRSVTDWAHYNHGYTSNILNEPFNDSIAYRKSSPIYYANGLQGNLLMCHGMVDVNVHFQDIVRLSQRLIELKKDNWELAVYPMEDHGFIEPSSWTDEYKRIYKLFEQSLKQKQ